jgi:hypothetical protein
MGGSLEGKCIDRTRESPSPPRPEYLMCGIPERETIMKIEVEILGGLG